MYYEKLFLMITIFIFFATAASAASAPQTFTTTIQSTDIKTVQKTIVKVFSKNDFETGKITDDKVTMSKEFGDGFFTAHCERISTFVLTPKNNNVVMSVSQVEKRQWMLTFDTTVNYILPLIKEVRTKIDGTPADQIIDETKAIADRQSQTIHGIILADKNTDDVYVISGIEEGGLAAEQGFKVGDAILEINGGAISDMQLNEINEMINQKWSAGSSLMILISRDGGHQIITLKSRESASAGNN